MKYVLVKNASLDNNCRWKLSSGEIICESEDYNDCLNKIPFPYDRSETRLKYIRGEWESLLYWDVEQGIVFCEQMIDINLKFDKGIISEDEYNRLDCELEWSKPFSSLYKFNKDLSINDALHYHLYAKALYSQVIPETVSECLYELSKIKADLTAKKLTYRNDIPCEQTNEDCSDSLEYLSEFEKLLLNQDFSDETVNAFFDECDDNFNAHPDARGFFVGEDIDLKKFGENYTIFIDFSDPEALLSELMSSIEKLGDSNNIYWAEELYEDILIRLLVPNSDDRNSNAIFEDEDQLVNALMEKLNLSDQQLEWMEEDLLK